MSLVMSVLSLVVSKSAAVTVAVLDLPLRLREVVIPRWWWQDEA